MRAPTLHIDGKVLTMSKDIGTAQKILAFSESRKTLEVDEFCNGHIELIADIFGTTPEEIKTRLDLPTVILKYFDCLEFTARELTRAADSVDDGYLYKGRRLKRSDRNFTLLHNRKLQRQRDCQSDKALAKG